MSLLVQGTEAFQAKNYAEAIALFTRAIETDFINKEKCACKPKPKSCISS